MEFFSLYKGAMITSFIYIIIAVVADFFFFGTMRNAIDKLYHPTTFYGYLFLISLPFILAFLFRKKLKHCESVTASDFIKYGFSGLFSIMALFVIIKLDIRI